MASRKSNGRRRERSDGEQVALAAVRRLMRNTAYTHEERVIILELVICTHEGPRRPDGSTVVDLTALAAAVGSTEATVQRVVEYVVASGAMSLAPLS